MPFAFLRNRVPSIDALGDPVVDFRFEKPDATLRDFHTTRKVASEFKSFQGRDREATTTCGLGLGDEQQRKTPNLG